MRKRIVLFAASVLAVGLMGCSQGDQTAQADYIGEEAAKNAALAASNTTQDQVLFEKVAMETQDGKAYYDIAFSSGQDHYTYDIDAMTGTVIAYRVEQGTATDTQQPLTEQPVVQQTVQPTEATPTPQQQPVAQTPQQQPVAQPPAPQQTAPNTKQSTATGEQKAMEKAVEHAGVSKDRVKFVKIKREFDDGRDLYEVEFYDTQTGAEYDYEIDATNYQVISYDYDAEDYVPQTSGNQSTVSEATVRQTVLAKVPGATEKHLRMHLERDDGRMSYEGTIVYNDMKYEFEVDAYSGAVREWEAESVYD